MGGINYGEADGTTGSGALDAHYAAHLAAASNTAIKLLALMDDLIAELNATLGTAGLSHRSFVRCVTQNTNFQKTRTCTDIVVTVNRTA